MKIGWLMDKGNWKGGAEYNAEAFRDGAPAGVEIVDCPSHAVNKHVDAYVIHNCNQYNAELIPLLETRPTIKALYDVTFATDLRLREWLLKHARTFILMSPPQREWLPFRIEGKVEYVASPVLMPPTPPLPLPINGEGEKNGRNGACWIGRLHPQKGPYEAAMWAKAQGIGLDMYGFGDMSLVFKPGDYKGKLEPEQVMGTLAKYKQFVFLPQGYDPCPRVIFEAHYAGCEIVTNGKQGATWWLEHDPAGIEQAVERFWEIVTDGNWCC